MSAQPSLTAAARQRGLITLLLDTFLMWAGFFMVVPLISVYYVEKLGWAAASIGLVLASRQFVQQGLTPISGVLADRFGAKGLICAGLLVRTLGFAAMAWADTFPLLLASTVLAALGGSLFDSPRSAAVAALTDESTRARYYSLNGVVSNLGLTLGTQIGALLLPFSFSLVALGAAVCFFATFLVTVVLMPPVRVATSTEGLTHGVRLVLRDRPFINYSLIMMGFWFMWVQLSISFPLAAQNVSSDPSTISWIFAVNSGMNILFQYPLLRLVSRRLPPLPILIIGVVVMALGMGAVGFAWSVPVLLGCVVVYALGSLLASPSQQTVAANLANPAALGSYFGVNSLSLAIGGGLGNLSGGLLYDIGKGAAMPELPWLVFGAVGLATAAALVLMSAHFHPRRKEPVPATVTEPEPELAESPLVGGN